jgi:hypothetical protein
MIALSSKAVIGLGFAAIFAQVVPPLAGAPPANSATQWTLEGALVIAVGFLARAVVALTKMNASDRATYAAALERKDEQIVAMVVKVTDAVVTNNHGM